MQIGAKTWRVSAREAEGDERERLWREVKARDRAYVTYEGRTDRRIPVIVLDPAIAGSPWRSG